MLVNRLAMSKMPSRRWLTYSLRSLFVAIGLMAIALGWLTNEQRQSRHEAEIAERLVAQGMFVQMIGAYDPTPVYPDFTPTGKSSWMRRTLSGLCGKRIHRSSNTCWLDDLDSFAGLSRLQSLVLGNVKCGAPVSDLSPLAGLDCLRHLSLCGTEVRDLSPLKGLKNLESLGLEATEIDDLAPISGLVSLKRLRLMASRTTDLAAIANLHNLEELDLDLTPVSDLSALAELNKLRYLSAISTEVHDLTPLKGLKNLRVLRVGLANVSEGQIKMLQAALPNCKID
jgi:hypothetical protein